MIVKVGKENELEWAKLRSALWPHQSLNEMFELLYNGKLHHEFLYVFSGKTIAFISLSLRQDYVEGTSSNPVGYLEGIYVKPEFQNRGIGRELVEFAKKWSLENGCKEFASDCEIENEESKRFHNSIGFNEVGIIVHFTMDLED